MILVLINAHLKPRAALLHPLRRFAAVFLDQALNIADAPAFGDDPRLSENPGGQLRNRRRPLCNSLGFPSNTFVVPKSPGSQMIGIFRRHVLYSLRPRLCFQDGSEFIAGNGMARIALAMTFYFFRDRMTLEPKLQCFTDHFGRVLVSGFAGNLDRANESLLKTERNSFCHYGNDTVRDSRCQSTNQERVAVAQRRVAVLPKARRSLALGDGKKIQKVTEVATGTESVVRAVSFVHR